MLKIVGHILKYLDTPTPVVRLKSKERFGTKGRDKSFSTKNDESFGQKNLWRNVLVAMFYLYKKNEIWPKNEVHSKYFSLVRIVVYT